MSAKEVITAPSYWRLQGQQRYRMILDPRCWEDQSVMVDYYLFGQNEVAVNKRLCRAINRLAGGQARTVRRCQLLERQAAGGTRCACPWPRTAVHGWIQLCATPEQHEGQALLWMSLACDLRFWSPTTCPSRRACAPRTWSRTRPTAVRVALRPWASGWRVGQAEFVGQ